MPNTKADDYANWKSAYSKDNGDQWFWILQDGGYSNGQSQNVRTNVSAGVSH